MKHLGRFGYVILARELEPLGSDGISRDETKQDYYWHAKTDRLIVHKWGECYESTIADVLAELTDLNQRMRQYAAQQADYGNWEPTERINVRQRTINAINAKHTQAPFQELDDDTPPQWSMPGSLGDY